MLSVKEALEETARRHNVPLSEVESEIQAVIDELYYSDKPEIRGVWREILPNGEKPTVEQLITYAAEIISAEQNPHVS